MGTLDQGPPPPLVQDLKVTILDSTLLFSSQESDQKSMFLSNIDKVLNFDVQTIHFFTSNPDFPPKIAFKVIKNALEKILVPYHFLAGRIKLNNETGRLEIDCNNGGIGYVEASSEYSLEALGDLVYPNPSFEQLVTKKMDNNNALKVDDHPLCIVQMTSFKCGGFAMAIQTNHSIFDGTAFKYFIQNLAALTCNKPLAVIPCNQRELLAARSPPRVTFPHPELLEFKIPIGQEGETEQNPNVFDDSPLDLDFKIFSLSQNDILALKARAQTDTNNNNDNNNADSVNEDDILALKAAKAITNDHNNNADSVNGDDILALKARAKTDNDNADSVNGDDSLTLKARTKTDNSNTDSVNGDDILALKARAKTDDHNNNNADSARVKTDNNNANLVNGNNGKKKGVKVTGFNVISALVWRCKALSSLSSEESKDKTSTFLFSVDIRSRLNPPLPPSYSGNAVLTAYARATCKELEEASLGRLVQLVSEGAGRMSDEYARSAIDWGEVHKGFPHGEFLLSSWWRLGFNQMECPWGKPKYCCPLVYHRKDIILLFPDIDEAKGGVNVLVTLPHREMLKFQALFNHYLSG